MLTFTSMSPLKAEPAAKPRRAEEASRFAAPAAAGDTLAAGLDAERSAALRAFHDAELEKKEIGRRLQQLRAAIGANISALSQQELPAYFDGWAPRDLPLLPSPIHRDLLNAEELASADLGQPIRPESAAADLRDLPPPGTLPELDYLPAWKRPLARFCGRLLLLLGGFLSLPQRAINNRLADRLEALEAQVANLGRERDHLRRGLLLLAERSAANFEFLDQCDRDRLLELHRKAEELRSEWRGDLERAAARLHGELADELELKAPGHRLALLEMEFASAETKSQLAWQRLLLAELRQRLDKTG